MAAALDIMDVLPQFLTKMTGAEISCVRLFTTLLYVYPLVILQRIFLTGVTANVHHIYHSLTAALLLYFNFGANSAYFFSNAIAFYILVAIIKDPQLLVISSFILNMTFLCYGYAITIVPADVYVVTWPSTHTILTLKLLGLTWDIYDGMQKDLKERETAVVSVPTFIEVLGFVCYPPGILTGPHTSFMRYKRFTDGEFNQYLPDSWGYGLLRLVTGVVVMVAHPFVHSYLPTEYFYTGEFESRWYGYKMMCLAIWSQILLAKYIGLWLVSEGSCIISGISFNGKDDVGHIKWDGCTNLNVTRFITVTRAQHVIDSFHISTNRWVATYIYKRLKFLNNRYISQGASLVFLSVWHGPETGYAICFFFEFLVISGETQIAALCEKKRPLKVLVNLPLLQPVIPLFTKFMSTFFLGYGLIGFEQLKYHNYMKIYRNMYFIPHIFFLLMPILYVVLSAVLPNDKVKEKKEQ